MNSELYNEIQGKIQETETYIDSIKFDINNKIEINENKLLLFVAENQLAAMKMLSELYNLNIHKEQ